MNTPTSRPITDEALRPFGWSERVVALHEDIASPDTVPARVIRTEKSACVVVAASGEHVAFAPELPSVGDWVSVRLRRDGGERVGDVAGVVPRWSALTRRDPNGLTQVLAANIDLVIVTAPADRLSPARVEREIAMAWESGATPVVAATKADVADPETVDDLRERLFGVDVVATSAVTGEGIEELRTRLQPAATAVLLGPSGAGKSSLVNALVGHEVMPVGAVRAGDKRGRHTTTSRQLLPIPSGGVVIDTPGLRSLSLSGSGEGVDLAFGDVVGAAAGCRFRDCRHTGEPGCAVAEAIATGEIAAERVDSYRKLQRDVDYETRRDDPLARKEAVRVWKIRTKAHRQRNPKR